MGRGALRNYYGKKSYPGPVSPCFVAVGTLGSAAYSVDGTTWTAVKMPVDTTWQGITYANNRFIAMGYSGNFAYSIEGKPWTLGVMPEKVSWYGSAYGNNRYVALGNGAAAYSTDGISWTAFTMPDSVSWRGITFASNRFVAVGHKTTSGQWSCHAAYSTNGISWSTVSIPYSPGYSSGVITRAVHCNGRFYALGIAHSCAYSTDGAAWTAFKMPVIYNGGGTSGTGIHYYGIAHGYGQYIAGGTYSYGARSANGTTWVEQAMPIHTTNGLISANNRFVVAGNSGIAYSDDGTNWTLAYQPAGVVFYDIVYG